MLIQAQAGTIVCFEHGLLHEANPVESGTKYAIRADVMYIEGRPCPVPRLKRNAQGLFVLELPIFADGELGRARSGGGR